MDNSQMDNSKVYENQKDIPRNGTFYNYRYLGKITEVAIKSDGSKARKSSSSKEPKRACDVENCWTFSRQPFGDKHVCLACKNNLTGTNTTNLEVKDARLTKIMETLDTSLGDLENILAEMNENSLYRDISNIKGKFKKFESICGIDSGRFEEEGYVYLVRDSKMKEGTCKVGKSDIRNINRRLTSYGKNRTVYRKSFVQDYHTVEDKLKERFNVKFQKATDGNEYFIGDWKEMAVEFDRVIFSLSGL